MIGTLRRLTYGRVGIWYHPSFRLPFSGVLAHLGMDTRRADDVLTFALDRDLVAVEDVFSPEESPWGWLEEVHTQAWLEQLDRPAALAHLVALDPELIPAESLIETWRRAVGGVVDATHWALQHRRRAMVLLGGFHHAFPDHGAAFCALNDVAVALSQARKSGFTGSCLVLDLDAHPPDGLVACMGSDPLVTILSLGVASEWSVEPAPAARVVDLRVPRGSTDEVYLTALRTLLSQLGTPDLVYLLAGADPLIGDRFGALAVSEAGLRQRDKLVLHALGHVATVILPAGGYTQGAWRVFAGTLSEAAQDGREVPPDYDPVRRRAGQISRKLDPDTLSGPDRPWFSPEDIAELTGEPVNSPRFLGYYTRHGIEHAFHQYGLLDHLARIGFRELRVEIEASSEPHRLRVLARIRDAMLPVVDLTVSVRPVLGMRTLFVEWLELRDPRLAFTRGRPRLPGQEYPGLGIAAECAQLLMRAARRVQLAGVSFIASNFHVAWMSRAYTVPSDPRARGRFRALVHAAEAVSLRRFSEQLSGEGLTTEDGDVIQWEPTEFVYAIDPALQAKLDLGEPEAAAAAEALSDRLLPLLYDPASSGPR